MVFCADGKGSVGRGRPGGILNTFWKEIIFLLVEIPFRIDSTDDQKNSIDRFFYHQRFLVPLVPAIDDGLIPDPIPGPSIKREDWSALLLLMYQGVEPEELAGVGGEKGGEGKRYPPVVVLPLLQRVFSKLRVRFEPESAKISFF